MLVIPGPASQELGRKTAELLKAKTVNVVFKRFPDGESYIRFEGELVTEEVVIVQTTSPPQDTNLFQLFLMADTAKELGARKIVAVVPYLAYSRQDKRFLHGEAFSIQMVAKLLGEVGVDQLLTVNVHQQKVLDEFPFPAKTVSAIPLLAEHFKHRGLEGAFALAPDEGAKEYAIAAAKILGGGYGWRHKERNRYTGAISFRDEKYDIKGKDAIIFDDIISTGGTTADAVKTLKTQGARRVFSACVHPLLIGDAEKKIMNNGAEEIVGTDCVPSPVSKVSVAPLIVKALSGKEA
ncbi:MAG TPA: ribose-phosphate diphosphokinase [Candidatus Krumholzibacteriaceae bacterium]|nr:ribose-phosphate diphosphokinase [Candidatus Krumholzibacteriaceae bacterium]